MSIMMQAVLAPIINYMKQGSARLLPFQRQLESVETQRQQIKVW